MTYNKNTKIYVTQIRQDNPEMTLLAIGNIVGITRERVRQILKKAGMETRSTKEVYERRPLHLKFGNKPCPTCDKLVLYRKTPKFGYYPKYHAECRPGTLMVDVVCPYCDKSFQLDKLAYSKKLQRLQNGSQKAIYCSHRCVINAYWDSVHQRIPNDYGYVMRRGRNTSPWITFQCGTCGVEKSIRDHEYSHRIKNSPTGLLFCNHTCLGDWIRRIHKKGT